MVKSKNKGFVRWFFNEHDFLKITLSVMGLIIVIYGAWFNNPLWTIMGFIPMFVGYWWEYINRK